MSSTPLYVRPCHRDLKLHHILSYQLSTILLWSTSAPPRTLYNQPLAPPHWCVYASPQSRFPHHVHHGGHSHLITNILISNFIDPNMTTHQPQHPHLHNMHFWTWEFLTRQHSVPYKNVGLTTTLWNLTLR